jgi:hypothetical protein
MDKETTTEIFQTAYKVPRRIMPSVNLNLKLTSESLIVMIWEEYFIL